MNVKTTDRLIYLFTAVVYVVVIILHEISTDWRPEFFNNIPFINACINGTCFLLLISSLIAIKGKKIIIHKRLNSLAMILSMLFLVLYILNHFTSGKTSYGGEWVNSYTIILLTHIVLAGVSLPFILLAYARAYHNNISGHRKLVRFAYPIWLYVTFSGVLVYMFLAPYYTN